MELWIESERGHDVIDVPDKPEEIQKVVEEQLKNDKWVTLKNKDGSSELLTEKDMPKESDEIEELDEEDKKLMKDAGDWKTTFGKAKPETKTAAKTATATASVKSTAKSTSKPREEWKSKFVAVETATANNKAKGG